MRILHINTLKRGGAARSTMRLHHALGRLGHDSHVLHAPSLPMDWSNRILRRAERLVLDSCDLIGWTPPSLLRYRHYLSSRPSGGELFSDDVTKYFGSLQESQLAPWDVINLHWVARFVDLRTFFSMVPEHVPVVWRLSDMNSFTGGCHYSNGCVRYNTGCGACPQLGSEDLQDLSSQVWMRKNSALQRLGADRLHIVAQSRWMAKVVSESELLGKFSVTVIPNGLDVDVFSPKNPSSMRKKYNIPSDVHVILFVADSLANKRKGFDLLSVALTGINKNLKPFLLSIGHKQHGLDTGFPHMHFESIEDDYQLAELYSMADIFVIPSREDNLPNTVIESMACGTPVVGFNVGGIPDMVHTGKTGKLVEPEDVDALQSAMTSLLEDKAMLKQMGQQCRLQVVQEYALSVQAERFTVLYNNLLAGASS